MTQQHQVGQMYAWLEEWGLPQSDGAERMAWMAGSGHAHTEEDGGDSAGSAGEDGLMPGMATDEEMARLAAATGQDAERLYLQLMIDHHEAGADMAEAGAELAQEPAVRELAQKMAEGQIIEIAEMEKLLAQL